MAIPTQIQRSAGGVVFRRREGRIEIALICVGEKRRWQLPKGLIEAGESPEIAAIRETREEAGVEGELVAPLEVVEYWYYATKGDGENATRTRYHKFVHFFLLEYKAGDVRNHDHEVETARWVSVEEAPTTVTFASERRVVVEAIGLLTG